MSLPAQLPEINLKELSELCASTPAEGCIVELGVYKGGSAWRLNQAANGRRLHLFDTFTGIPEKSEIDGFNIGAFGDVDLESIKMAIPGAVFHVGIFPGTFPANFPAISFVHIDCDQYLTCKEAIKLFWPLVLPGGIMAWDDYPFAGIAQAIHETFKEVQWSPCKIPYVVKGGM